MIKTIRSVADLLICGHSCFATPMRVHTMNRKILTLVFLFLPITAVAGEPWQANGVPAIQQQEVHFSNGNTHLAGTLYLPATGNHLPAVVVEHGAEAPTRDFALYAHLERDLPAIGVAVLVYDRRGSGASTGNREDASYEMLADDAVAGQHEIAKNPRINSEKIGFWGLSQGGWLSILAANRSPDAAFAISVSAPLVTPDVQMNYAVHNLLLARGYGVQAANDAVEAREAHDAFTIGKLSRGEAMKALSKADDRPWSSLTFLPSASELTKDPANSRWHKEMLYDPLENARAAHVPVLFIYGGVDPWVPVAESIKRLNTLTPSHPNFAYYVVPDANHTMTRVSKETMQFDPASLKADAPDAPEYFMILASWLSTHVR